MKESGSQACVSGASKMRAAHCFLHRNRETNGHFAPGWMGRPAGKTLVRVFPQTRP